MAGLKHWVTYPLISHPYDPAFVTKDALARFARAAEAAGFDGIGFTDHPAPSDRWLRSGGHDALDPFAALAFVAAITDRMLLIPNILVLAYRNPFLVAKAAATIDALSDGRFVLSTAVGYQRGEYNALGVDFDERNALFDEALAVVQGIWTTDQFAHEGLHFRASGQTVNPKPSRIPIWIGGNSKLSRQRVADHGDAWNPFPAPAPLSAVTKTPKLDSMEDLALMLDDLWRRVDEAGRDRADMDIGFVNLLGPAPGTDGFNIDQHLTGLDQMTSLGVTWNSVGVPGDSIDHAIDTLGHYGAEIIEPTRATGRPRR